ncbi:MAG: universal stress protein [Actinomycetota bacterium]
MAPTVIVSYDGTENDTDALALGRVLGAAGASLALAYVRHSREAEAGRERLAQDDAAELLEAGSRWLEQPDVPRHVVLSGSTPEGLRDLAEQEGADVIAFGSEYRTAPGHLAPQGSAQRLLDGGPVAIALAPAGYRDRGDFTVATVAAVSDDPGDPSARETAESLASALGAELLPKAGVDTGLVVVSSKPGTASGRVTLSASAAYLVDLLLCPVLVLPHGVALRFGGR